MLNNATKYLPQQFYGADAQWRNAAANDHKIILAALRSRDVGAARDSVVSHVRDGKKRLLDHLDSIEFWS
jgi:DNA-binding GntR family transcriptional regulator